MTFCSDASRARGEALRATASSVQAFLLIEDPGPWGPQILRSKRLPEQLRPELAGWARQLGVRTLLIRRPGRNLAGPRNVFAVNAAHGWSQTIQLTDLGELLDRIDDPAKFRSSEGLGWQDHQQPLVLVCTHGKHDVCCARRGRPVAATLAQQYPELTWESSHVGGDRFAGNLVMLPRGDYFGQLDADEAPELVRRYLAGELDLAHHRGRSTLPWVVQAAEAEVRSQLQVTGFDQVQHLGSKWTGDAHLVRLAVGAQQLTARVQVGRKSPAQLTCTSTREEEQPDYQVQLLPADAEEN